MPGAVVPFVEVIAGLSAPLGTDYYDGLVRGTGILGARGGMQGPGIGVDVGAEWHRAQSETVADGSIDFDRVRVMMGARAGLHLTPRVWAYGRIAGGVDIANLKRIYFAEGAESFQGRDYGVALEPSIGLAVRLGSVAVGAQLAVPIAIHAGRNPDLDFDYTSFDAAVLATVSLDLE